MAFTRSRVRLPSGPPPPTFWSACTSPPLTTCWTFRVNAKPASWCRLTQRYNGGPVNAGHLRAASGETAAETQDYVLKVTGVYDGLTGKFGRGIEAQLSPMHNDVTREHGARGKTTAVERPRGVGSLLPHSMQ